MKPIVNLICIVSSVCLFNFYAVSEEKKQSFNDWMKSNKDTESTDERVLFLRDFLNRINSDKPFSLEDNKKFLGNEYGGLLGIALHRQMGFLDLSGTQIKWIKEKPKRSFIGYLLQLNKSKIFPKKILHFHYFVSDKIYGLSPKAKNSPFKLQGSHISYVTVLINGFRDQDNLDVESRMLLFRLSKDENSKKYEIQLFGSYIDNHYFSDFLGFSEKMEKHGLVYELKKEELKNLKD